MQSNVHITSVMIKVYRLIKKDLGWFPFFEAEMANLDTNGRTDLLNNLIFQVICEELPVKILDQLVQDSPIQNAFSASWLSMVILYGNEIMFDYLFQLFPAPDKDLPISIFVECQGYPDRILEILPWMEKHWSLSEAVSCYLEELETGTFTIDANVCAILRLLIGVSPRIIVPEPNGVVEKCIDALEDV